MIKADLGKEISFDDINNIKIFTNPEDVKKCTNYFEIDYSFFEGKDFKLYLNYSDGLLSQTDAETNNAFGIGYVNLNDLRNEKIGGKNGNKKNR